MEKIFLGAKAPLGPVDVKVKVKVKAKKFQNSMILPESPDDLEFCYGHIHIMVVTNITQCYLVLPNID